mmetsp:Transcript_6254/g.14211  ORF Transcript_6254/g.14211 Transcript_6254/m.14211 type:complete len:308 (+) Transcript_6254:79-1002(+)
MGCADCIKVACIWPPAAHLPEGTGTQLRRQMLLFHVVEGVSEIATVLYIYTLYDRVTQKDTSPQLFFLWATFLSFGAIVIKLDAANNFWTASWLLYLCCFGVWQNIEDASGFYGNCCLTCPLLPVAFALSHCPLIVALVIAANQGHAAAVAVLCAAELLLCHGGPALLPPVPVGCCNGPEASGLESARARAWAQFHLPGLGFLTVLHLDDEKIQQLSFKYFWDQHPGMVLGDVPFGFIAALDLCIYGSSISSVLKLAVTITQIILLAVVRSVLWRLAEMEVATPSCPQTMSASAVQAETIPSAHWEL